MIREELEAMIEWCAYRLDAARKAEDYWRRRLEEFEGELAEMDRNDEEREDR